VQRATTSRPAKRPRRETITQSATPEVQLAIVSNAVPSQPLPPPVTSPPEPKRARRGTIARAHPAEPLQPASMDPRALRTPNVPLAPTPSSTRLLPAYLPPTRLPYLPSHDPLLPAAPTPRPPSVPYTQPAPVPTPFNPAVPMTPFSLAQHPHNQFLQAQSRLFQQPSYPTQPHYPREWYEHQQRHHQQPSRHYSSNMPPYSTNTLSTSFPTSTHIYSREQASSSIPDPWSRGVTTPAAPTRASQTWSRGNFRDTNNASYVPTSFPEYSYGLSSPPPPASAIFQPPSMHDVLSRPFSYYQSGIPSSPVSQPFDPYHSHDSHNERQP